ncbi:MAG: hypothetical protein WCA28_33710, partial [Bradyrhizobium sp.]
HTPCTVVLTKVLVSFPSFTNIGGYGSLLSQGRRPMGQREIGALGQRRSAAARPSPALGQWPTWQMKAERNRSFTVD